MRLNGWQRLWVLVSSLWLFVVAPVTYFGFIPDAPRSPIAEVRKDGKRTFLLDVDMALEFDYDAEKMMLLVRKDTGLDYRATDGELKPLDLLRFVQCTQSGNTHENCISHAHGFIPDDLRQAVPIDAQLRPAEQEYGLVRVKNPKLFTEAFASVQANHISRYRSELAAVLAYAALVWLGPLLGVYLFGAGVAWVRRGFRELN